MVGQVELWSYWHCDTRTAKMIACDQCSHSINAARLVNCVGKGEAIVLEACVVDGG